MFEKSSFCRACRLRKCFFQIHSSTQRVYKKIKAQRYSPLQAEDEQRKEFITMSEIKPRSMRMSDENYMRLQGLSEGRSLDETITYLLSTHDKDEARNGLGNQAIKLDELDEFLNAIRSQFTALLHTCQNAKDVVRAEYRKELDEKNASIESMKDEILKLQKDAMRKDASAQETIEKLRVQLEDRKKEVTSLESKIAEEGKNASQKQQVIDSLSSALTSAEKKAAQLETAAKQLSETETALKELRAQYEELKEEQKRIRKQLEEKETLCSQMKETHTQELERHKNDYIRQLETCKNESEKQLQQLKEQKEQEQKTLQQTCELSIREAQIGAQDQINRIKEEYQNKLFELLMKEKAL